MVETEDATESSEDIVKARKDNDEANQWYFAIGSMMLPESCQLRGFCPHESIPGKLLDYELQFFGAFGVAQACRKEGSNIHGVLQRVTAEQMIQLDKFEAVYIRENAKAIPYGQEDPVDVTVYVRAPPGHPKDLFRKKTEIDNPPNERYLDLILAGAKHYSLENDYIQFLQKHPKIPRHLPVEFCSFGEPPSQDVVWDEMPPDTEDEFYTSLNGKILRYTFPKDNNWYEYTKDAHKRLGRCSEMSWSRTFFDIKYGAPEAISEFTKEHSAYIEDMLYCFMELHECLDYVTVVAKYGAQTWRS